MGSHGISWNFHGASWYLMEFHCNRIYSSTLTTFSYHFMAHLRQLHGSWMAAAWQSRGSPHAIFYKGFHEGWHEIVMAIGFMNVHEIP